MGCTPPAATWWCWPCRSWSQTGRLPQNEGASRRNDWNRRGNHHMKKRNLQGMHQPQTTKGGGGTTEEKSILAQQRGGDPAVVHHNSPLGVPMPTHTGDVAYRCPQGRWHKDRVRGKHRTSRWRWRFTQAVSPTWHGSRLSHSALAESLQRPRYRSNHIEHTCPISWAEVAA